MPARVVIDEKTGTIVIGADVRVSPVAVAHGNITIRVDRDRQWFNPSPSPPARRRSSLRQRLVRTGGLESGHVRRAESRTSCLWPEPVGLKAAGHYRHTAGDQDGGSAARPIWWCNRRMMNEGSMRRILPRAFLLFTLLAAAMWNDPQALASDKSAAVTQPQPAAESGCRILSQHQGQGGGSPRARQAEAMKVLDGKARGEDQGAGGEAR